MTVGKIISIAIMVTMAFIASCSDEADPGPLDIDGWIGQCEDRCDQLNECSYDQLVFDHGDLDNCKGSCEYRLDYEDNLETLESTSEECLAAAYDYLDCVYGLGCDDLTTWATSQEDDRPCSGEELEMYTTCEGYSIGGLLDDAGYPSGPQ